MTDNQYGMAQGVLEKFTIIRDGKEIDCPEVVGAVNQRRLFFDTMVSFTPTSQSEGVGLLALSATAPTKFRTLSGSTWDFAYATNTFTRASGTAALNTGTEPCVVLCSNGLVGQLTPSTASTGVTATFYSLSNGLSAAPIPHFGNFTGVSAKIFQGPIFTGFPYVATAASINPTYLSSFNSNNQIQVWKRSNTWNTDVVAVDNTIGSITIGQRAGLYTMNSSYAHIILPAPVAVLAGDQISLTYSLSASIFPMWGVDVTMSEYVNGWPFRYNITNLSGNGVNVTASVASTPLMHFLSGDTITVEAVPLRKAITSINSNGTIWTVAVTGHGLTPGQSIVHENISNIAYNGVYVVNTTPDANTYTVANVTSPGASSGGTVRLATPGTYFSGEYQVLCASATTVVYACTATTPAPDIATCILSSPDRAKFYALAPALPYGGWTHCALHRANNISATPLPSNAFSNPFYLGATPLYTTNNGANTAPQVSLGINTTPNAGSGPVTVNDFNRIKRISSHRYINNNYTGTAITDFCAFIDLVTPQPKHQGYTLVLNTPRLPAGMFSEVPAYADA